MNFGVLALRYFQKLLKSRKEAILFNVTLKVFWKCRDMEGADKLFDEMLNRGAKPGNLTFSTIITSVRLFSLSNKAIELFVKMPNFDCNPDDVTNSAMIDAYGYVLVMLAWLSACMIMQEQKTGASILQHS